MCGCVCVTCVVVYGIECVSFSLCVCVRVCVLGVAVYVVCMELSVWLCMCYMCGCVWD